MKPHAHAKIFETPLSTYWFDEDGILCSLTKKAERTIENYQQVMKLYETLIKDRDKLCLLSDSINSAPMTKEITDYMSKEHPKYLKALAILSSAPLETSQVNAFLKLTFSDFPVMMFATETEARKWLKDYM